MKNLENSLIFSLIVGLIIFLTGVVMAITAGGWQFEDYYNGYLCEESINKLNVGNIISFFGSIIFFFTALSMSVYFFIIKIKNRKYFMSDFLFIPLLNGLSLGALVVLIVSFPLYYTFGNEGFYIIPVLEDMVSIIANIYENPLFLGGVAITLIGALVKHFFLLDSTQE